MLLSVELWVPLSVPLLVALWVPEFVPLDVSELVDECVPLSVCWLLWSDVLVEVLFVVSEYSNSLLKGCALSSKDIGVAPGAGAGPNENDLV